MLKLAVWKCQIIIKRRTGIITYTYKTENRQSKTKMEYSNSFECIKIIS